MNEWSLQPARTMGKRPLIAADQPASEPDVCLWYAPTHVTLLTSLGDRSWDSRTFAHRRTSYSKIALSDTRPPSSNARKPIAGAGEKRVHPAAARTAATWPASALPAATRPCGSASRGDMPGFAGSTSISAAARSLPRRPSPTRAGRALHRHGHRTHLHRLRCTKHR